MSILRLTLTTWADLGQASATVPGGQPGTVLTGRITMIPSVGQGAVIDPDGGLHTVAAEVDMAAAAPWQYDLLDPTDANPTGWGWTVKLKTPGSGREIVAPLTPEAIAAVAQVDGVRTIALRLYAGLSDVLTPGGLVVLNPDLTVELAAFLTAMEA